MLWWSVIIAISPAAVAVPSGRDKYAWKTMANFSQSWKVSWGLFLMNRQTICSKIENQKSQKYKIYHKIINEIKSAVRKNVSKCLVAFISFLHCINWCNAGSLRKVVSQIMNLLLQYKHASKLCVLLCNQLGHMALWSPA